MGRRLEGLREQTQWKTLKIIERTKLCIVQLLSWSGQKRTALLHIGSAPPAIDVCCSHGLHHRRRRYCRFVCLFVFLCSFVFESIEGSLLANRLSQRHSVLLLEAGGSGNSPSELQMCFFTRFLCRQEEPLSACSHWILDEVETRM